MWIRIKQINWAKRWKDNNAYLAAKQFILDSYSVDECKKITEFVNEMHAALSERVRFFENSYGFTCGNYNGVDSFNDMLSHVIGLGEEFYNEILNDPKKLNGMPYYESFLYCLPHNEDFEIRRETEACVVELNRIVTETGNNAIIANLMHRFRLMLSGQFNDATDDIDEKTYNNMRSFTGNDCDAKFANLIRDCNKFYVSY